MRAVLLLLGVVFVLGGPPAAAEDDPFECPVRAVLFEEDAGLLRVYDGIRRGLEQAHLPRVCLERATEEEPAAAVLDRLERDGPPPLLFVLGRETARLVGTRLAATPRVLVTTTWYAGGEPLEPPPTDGAKRSARVDGVLSATRLRDVLAGMFPGLVVRAVLPGATDAGRTRLFEALRVRAPDARPDVVLDLDLGERAPLPAGVPVVSDDVGRWGRGAVVVLSPDHILLGRIAADAGRRLLGDDAAVEATRMSTSEVRVDVEAAEAVGFAPPLPFLAGADLIRRARR